jgi:hypothetical protein
MYWEEGLNYYSKILDASLKYRNKKSILTIEMFLRKEKLKNLNNL